MQDHHNTPKTQQYRDHSRPLANPVFATKEGNAQDPHHHPHAAGVIQRHRSRKWQDGDRKKPGGQREISDQTPPRVHPRNVAAHRNALPTHDDPDEQGAKHAPIKHQFSGREFGGRHLDAHAHARKQKRPQNHP